MAHNPPRKKAKFKPGRKVSFKALLVNKKRVIDGVTLWEPVEEVIPYKEDLHNSYTAYGILDTYMPDIKKWKVRRKDDEPVFIAERDMDIAD